ncbi:N-acetylmuramoyl-L-alanine amidase family protein, partial [Clostridium perfringens]
VMRKGWVELNGSTYYFNNLGRMVKGWLKLDNDSYYFKESGQIYKGWLDLDDKSYYLDINTGVMATDTKILGGKTFYFGNDGV